MKAPYLTHEMHDAYKNTTGYQMRQLRKAIRTFGKVFKDFWVEFCGRIIR